ncbi:MAG: nuclear transport factor 2 family protein [Spirochaetes bacterium]|nr:nuclear transport factor 2 family protein [Spirochaetota bacterium]
MEYSYDDIVKWMEEYLNAYNLYAQNPETVNKMAEYFTPDVHFIPFISAFGGPDNPVTSRDEFFKMFLSHPSVYEQFEVEDVFVDERKMVASASLNVSLYETKTKKVLLKKHYHPRYQLVLDENEKLKIKTIYFFWECVPPEVDKAYAIELD